VEKIKTSYVPPCSLQRIITPFPLSTHKRARTNHTLVTQNATMTPRRSHGNIVASALATRILRGRQRLDHLSTVSTSSFSARTKISRRAF
jgi:hypothetical protein